MVEWVGRVRWGGGEGEGEREGLVDDKLGGLPSIVEHSAVTTNRCSCERLTKLYIS